MWVVRFLERYKNLLFFFRLLFRPSRIDPAAQVLLLHLTRYFISYHIQTHLIVSFSVFCFPLYVCLHYHVSLQPFLVTNHLTHSFLIIRSLVISLISFLISVFCFNFFVKHLASHKTVAISLQSYAVCVPA